MSQETLIKEKGLINKELAELGENVKTEFLFIRIENTGNV